MIHNYLLQSEQQVSFPWNEGIIGIIQRNIGNKDITQVFKFTLFDMRPVNGRFGAMGEAREISATTYGLQLPQGFLAPDSETTYAVLYGDQDPYNYLHTELVASVLGLPQTYRDELHEDSLFVYPEGLVQILRSYPMNAPSTLEILARIPETSTYKYQWAFSLQLADLVQNPKVVPTHPFAIHKMASAIFGIETERAPRLQALLSGMSGENPAGIMDILYDIQVFLMSNFEMLNERTARANTLTAAAIGGNYRHFQIGLPDIAFPLIRAIQSRPISKLAYWDR